MLVLGSKSAGGKRRRTWRVRSVKPKFCIGISKDLANDLLKIVKLQYKILNNPVKILQQIRRLIYFYIIGIFNFIVAVMGFALFVKADSCNLYGFL